MKFKAEIYITLRSSILDPQGSAVLKSLKSLNYDKVESVRIGKFMEVVVQAEDQSAAEAYVRELCRVLLTNPVMEDYTLTLTEV